MINIKKELGWNIRGASAFTPLSLSPVAWWDNGPTYMAADGSQWTDRVNGLNLTATGSAKPTFTAGAQNGLPSFTFDGVANSLDRARITQIQAKAGVTLWAVGKRCIMSQDANATNKTTLIHTATDILYGYISAGTDGHGLKSTANAFKYYVMVFDGSQATNDLKLLLYINGVLQTSLNFQATTIPTATENGATSRMQLGAWNLKTTFFAGQSLEHGIVASALTSTQVANLNTYLAAKYAL